MARSCSALRGGHQPPKAQQPLLVPQGSGAVPAPWEPRAAPIKPGVLTFRSKARPEIIETPGLCATGTVLLQVQGRHFPSAAINVH